jgi:protein Mpv17
MLRYQSQLARRPVLTQSITTAVRFKNKKHAIILTVSQLLFGAGDTLAQQLVEKRGFKNHDIMRSTRMVSYGGCMAHRRSTIIR